VKQPRVVCLGPHILDVLIRPVEAIPAGQGGLILDQARVTAAGTAAGTAVDLAKLGAAVSSMGVVGGDVNGRLVRMLLEECGVDTSRVAVREGMSTPTTVLPIRANGERPSLHLPGAIGAMSAADVDLAMVGDADVLHVGGPDALGAFTDEELPAVLDHAARHSTRVTLDLLRNRPADGLLERLDRIWPYVDLFLPNDDQLRTLTGQDDLGKAAEVMRGRGVGAVVVTTGASGSRACWADNDVPIPAFDIEVVDTTGCGDAFSAGLILGTEWGWSLPMAARLGTAAAALVAQGLGSDAGIIDLAGTLAFWSRRADEMGVEPPAVQGVQI
jgi:sugar/nucleoside kinase (ribokinase family)